MRVVVVVVVQWVVEVGQWEALVAQWVDLWVVLVALEGQWEAAVRCQSPRHQ